MKIYRIDAVFAGDALEHEAEPVLGQFTRLLLNWSEAYGQHKLLIDTGWEADLYEEEIDPLAAGLGYTLCAGTWPTLPVEQILDLAQSAKLEARRRLAEIQQGREERREAAHAGD